MTLTNRDYLIICLIILLAFGIFYFAVVGIECKLLEWKG
jgi:hypothetical protein